MNLNPLFLSLHHYTSGCLLDLHHTALMLHDYKLVVEVGSEVQA